MHLRRVGQFPQGILGLINGKFPGRFRIGNPLSGKENSDQFVILLKHRTEPLPESSPADLDPAVPEFMGVEHQLFPVERGTLFLMSAGFDDLTVRVPVHGTAVLRDYQGRIIKNHLGIAPVFKTEKGIFQFFKHRVSIPPCFERPDADGRKIANREILPEYK